jgi:ABC-type sugar transport system ATPase subunit
MSGLPASVLPYLALQAGGYYMGDTFLRLRGISKSFGGVHALVDVDLDVQPGQVHAIVGENGAGKSTLMKIIAGAHSPDKGEMLIRGEKTVFTGPRDAARHGIAMVYQEPVFYPYLSVLENFFTGEELVTRWGRIDQRRMRAEAAKAVIEFGLEPDVLDVPMSELSMGDQQIVLISRAVYRNADLIILDEPTSILSQAETDILFDIIKRLQGLGKSILYISHRLKEIFTVSDCITVLRDGQVAGYMSTEDATDDLLVHLMTGRKVERTVYQSRTAASEKPMLQVKDLTLEPLYRHVSFSIHPGEIIGFYGLVGSGRSEVARTIFGDLHADSGTIHYEGELFAPKSPKDAISHHIAYIPEDRKRQGVFAICSITENLVNVIMGRIARMGWLLNKSGEREIAGNYVDALRIKVAGLEYPVLSLSGGNQQKVVIGRWLASEPDLVIMDEPTRGVDVGTKAEIHRLIRKFAKKGKAVMLISSELPEILALSDRIVIMYEGDHVAELAHDEANEESVLRWAIGLGAAAS